MKLARLIKKRISRDIKLTINSFIQFYKYCQKNWFAYVFVSQSWTNVMYGIGGGLFAVAVGIWLANIGIIQQVLESNALDSGAKALFLFDVMGTMTKNISVLQASFVMCGLILVGLSGMFWFAALKHQHDNPHATEKLAGALFGHIFSLSVYIVAVSLITPSLTRDGINVFISAHYSGTILLIFAVLLQSLVLKSFFRSFRTISEHKISY